MATLLGLKGLVRLLHTNLVACPGLSISWEMIPLGEGLGGHRSSPAWSEAWQSFDPQKLLWTLLMCGSYQSSQPGWLEQILTYSILFYSIQLAS